MDLILKERDELMTTKIAKPASLQKNPWKRFCINFKKNWQLHLLIMIPFAWFLLQNFGPMYGLIIAFKDYSPRKGIWDSEWVGLMHYVDFFSNDMWSAYLSNTLILSLYSIVIGFPIPILFALMIHINTHDKFKKIVQNVSYLPHFISIVILVGMINALLSPMSGVYGVVGYALLGKNPPDIRSAEETFYHLYQWSGTWQNMGWSAIMYVAALAGVSPELHEAAKIDGASRVQRVINVDLPAILPTICIMLIMRFGSIVSVGQEKALLMQYGENIRKSEILSTYIYKAGIGNARTSFGTAVGLLNSVVNSALVILVNTITDRLSNGENSLF